MRNRIAICLIDYVASADLRAGDLIKEIKPGRWINLTKPNAYSWFILQPANMKNIRILNINTLSKLERILYEL